MVGGGATGARNVTRVVLTELLSSYMSLPRREGVGCVDCGESGMMIRFDERSKHHVFFFLWRGRSETTLPFGCMVAAEKPPDMGVPRLTNDREADGGGNRCVHGSPEAGANVGGWLS